MLIFGDIWFANWLKIVQLVQKDNLAQDWHSFKERNPNVCCELWATREEADFFSSYGSK